MANQLNEHLDQSSKDEKHKKLIQKIQINLQNNNCPINGSDDYDRQYKSIESLWRTVGILAPLPNHHHNETKNQTNNEKDPDQISESSQESWYWYEQASDHYDEQPATLQGMLGGFASLSPHDLISSRKFLLTIQKQIQPELKFESICDCGAGIGRITKGLFWKLPGFAQCDLVEGSWVFLKQAEVYLNKDIECQIVTEPLESSKMQTTNHHPVQHKSLPKCRFIAKGLQDFHPQSNYYDVIWIQWVIGYLTDYDCVLFFQRCAEAMKENGILCLKDNMIASRCEKPDNGDDTDATEAFILDREDSSVTRSKAYLEAIIHETGCWTKIYEEEQEGFPTEIFPVWMMAYKVKR